MIEIIGYLAGALCTLSFLPQVMRTWRTRSANDLSLTMLVSFNLGVALWLVYGLMVQATPIVVANLITLFLGGALIVLKFTFGRRPPEK